MKVRPFKVICVDGIKTGAPGITTRSRQMGFAVPSDEIYERETYTVTETEEHFGKTYYRLMERSARTMYNSKRFIPLSEIDEAERSAEHEQEALIYQR